MTKKSAIIALTTILLFLSLPGFSKTLIVPGEAATIQEGIDLSDEFDTVLVLPGLYIENISILDKTVSIISTDGPSVTNLEPLDADSPVLTDYKWTTPTDPLAHSQLSGFTISGGKNSPTIYIELLSAIEISDNIFCDNIPITNFDKSVIICAGDSSAPKITRNIFYDNYGNTCVDILAGSAQVINNTLDGNRAAFRCNSDLATILNNIITNSIGTAVDGVFLRLDYNVFWGNASDYG
jgi:hypothetical protein